jgi:hypothetical protein
VGYKRLDAGRFYPIASWQLRPDHEKRRFPSHTTRMEVITYIAGSLFALFGLVSATVGTLGYKSLCIWTGFVAFCFAGLAGACWLQNSEWKKAPSGTLSPSFNYSITVENGWLSAARTMEDRWWLVFGDIACPVHGLWFIRVTNTGTTPIMIDSYSVDVLDNHNKWVSLTTMRANGAFYITPKDGDWTKASRLEIQQESFDRAISDKNIAPNETVRGWILLETAKGDLGAVELQARFHLKDVPGSDSIRPIELLNISDSAQPRSFKLIGKQDQDISQVKREFYSEVFPRKPKAGGQP